MGSTHSRSGARAILVVLVVLVLGALASPAAAGNGKLLLVGPTLWPGLVPDPNHVTDSGVSVEQAQGELLGEGVDVVDATAFGALTTAQIAAYDAVVMGDPGCGVHAPPPVVLARAPVWGPAITGNVIVLGAGPVYDYVGTGVPDPRAIFAVDAALSFALGDPSHTGAYIDLSCYYRNAPAGTDPTMLDPLGDFAVTGGCGAAAHLELGSPPPPPFDLLSDYGLSNWWACSAYETFDRYPAEFAPVASSSGAPYILARGLPATPPVDTTAPAITLATPPEGAVYSLGESVMADYSCTDGGSGLAACDGDVPSGSPIDTSTLGAHTFTVRASDNAGNATSLTHAYTVADLVAPTVTLTTPADGAVYDFGEVVVASYACADAGGSGLATCTGTVPSGAAVPTDSLGLHTFTVSATDNAGNATTVGHSYTVVDRIRPVITITTPVNGGAYEQGALVYAAYNCSDAGGSGLASCAGPVASGAAIDTATVGPHTFTVTSTDGAGNVSSASVTYTVTSRARQCSVEGEGRVGTSSFELEAEVLRETAHGSVDFTDRAGRHSFHGTVTAMSCDGPTARLSGTGSDNARRGLAFVVTVHDGGRSGDTLAISWPGYTASGAVTSGGIQIRAR